jgi:hypothetical protein
MTRLDMLHTAALPFVLHCRHSVVHGHEVTSFHDQIHGLLHVNGTHLRIQWRTVREINRVGRETHTALERAPLREVQVPLSWLNGARVRRTWVGWRRKPVLVLTAADLRAFDALTGEENMPGLILAHPAEMVLELRRSDRKRAREFVGELRLAISEFLLSEYDDATQRHLAPDPPLPPAELGRAPQPADLPAHTRRQKV